MIIGELLDRNVRCNPEKEAMVYHDQRWSYRELGYRANQFTHSMMELGMKKGDRIAVLLKNTPEYLVAWFGGFQGGGVIVPLNWRIRPNEVDYIVNQSDAKYFLFGADFLDMVQDLKPRLQGVEQYIMIGGDPPPDGILSYERLLDSSSTQKPQVAVEEGDVAIQMYTSGTTGHPKGALLTHRNITAGAYFSVISQESNRNSRLLVVAPLFHIGACSSVLPLILLGGAIVIMDQFDPKGVLETLEKEKITHSFFVPTMLKMMLDVPGVENYDLSSLEQITFGGAPMTYDLLLECLKVFKCDLENGFGQTEAGPFISSMHAHDIREIAEDPELQHRLVSVGKDWPPGVHIRIVDENDNDVPIGEVGEIVLRSDTVMTGYYKMPEETAQTLRGGWLHTGDMGKFDKDRFIYLVDRKKDMIISGGENIYSPEIENMILSLPGVVETAVVGIPHEKWGEVPKAFVVQTPNADLTEEMVTEHCTKNLAGFKCPKAVVFLEALPRNAAGKVLKKNLRGS